MIKQKLTVTITKMISITRITLDKERGLGKENGRGQRQENGVHICCVKTY